VDGGVRVLKRRWAGAWAAWWWLPRPRRAPSGVREAHRLCLGRCYLRLPGFCTSVTSRRPSPREPIAVNIVLSLHLSDRRESAISRGSGRFRWTVGGFRVGPARQPTPHRPTQKVRPQLEANQSPLLRTIHDPADRFALGCFLPSRGGFSPRLKTRRSHRASCRRRPADRPTTAPHDSRRAGKPTLTCGQAATSSRSRHRAG
jgi:hypothetical protein